jgi:hypothetical protein
MKIAIRGGHNFQAIGANALIDETTEDRKVKDAVIKYLTTMGHEVLDVTPENCDVNTDLAYGVNKANNWGSCDYFISIHFNKAYNNYNGAIGTETWIYGTGGKAEPMAKRIVDKLASLEFKNRGVKVNSKLYELKATNMSAIIVEVCFVEATEDVRIYKEKGYDLVGKVIAEGIINQEINTQIIQGDVKKVEEIKVQTTSKITKLDCGGYCEGVYENGEQTRLIIHLDSKHYIDINAKDNCIYGYIDGNSGRLL